MAYDKKKKIHFYGLCLGIILLVTCVAYFGWSLSGAGYNEERQYTDSSNVSTGLQHTADELDNGKAGVDRSTDAATRLEQSGEETARTVESINETSAGIGQSVRDLEQSGADIAGTVESIKARSSDVETRLDTVAERLDKCQSIIDKYDTGRAGSGKTVQEK